MKQKIFVENVVERISTDPNVIGLAAGGSWITNELDEFSDVDLILVTANPVAPNPERMMAYARSFGHFLTGFTGEHVGERRLLICLYDHPLLHVDIKFLTLKEMKMRVEDPVILFDPTSALKKVIAETKSSWPALDYQWIEDRFWTWIHYAAMKLGRGEDFEALDFLASVRSMVTAPLLQVRNKQLPRWLRKVEFNWEKQDISKLTNTVAGYDPSSLFEALDNTVSLYRDLRKSMFPPDIKVNAEVESKTLDYLNEIRHRRLK